MNVAQWLNAIDLGQYEPLFREHEIDVNVVPDLAEGDLEKTGAPLGHRKRLMRAIAALSAGGTPPAAKPTSAPPKAAQVPAERRPITVMFCDLVGSTSLAATLLGRRWERALKGEGQLALVVGEPGIGKSRLIEEFRARLGETPYTFVEWSSSQLLQNTPLYRIAEWGRLRFGADLPGEQRLADLENTLRLIGLDATEYVPLIAPPVDVPLPQERAATFPPEELRRRQLAAMTALVLAGARSQPAVVAFEDLHWADPTSLDLMRALAERGAG
jgi:AAA ATPase domain/SAM domain (Sterile alpha motif)